MLIQPAERGPGGGLTATYCTQPGMIENGPLLHRMLVFMVKMGRLGASWDPLGGSSWGQDGAKLGQVGPKMGQVGTKLGLSWHLEPSWRQLGGDLQHKLT